MDWSERRPHLAGALGAALLTGFVELEWLERLDGERVVFLTSAGVDGLNSILDDADVRMLLERTFTT